jgi:hypothetical protein
MIDLVSYSRVLCRGIGKSDIERVVDLLTKGFYPSHRDDWVRRFQCLSEHPTPSGFPKYGYLLECKDTVVGVSLLIYSSILFNGETRIRCNVSSWYVEPAFRDYGSMLTSHGRGHKNVIYFNVTPVTHTLPVLEAKGYVRYSSGQFAALPALCSGSRNARVELITADQPPDRNLPRAESELLSAHAGYGCISVTCTSEEGTYPFVFVPRTKFGFIPYVHLIYCRDLADFVRFARALGRFLAKRHFLLAVLDANGPIRGLVGAYFIGCPKYFKGPDRPRLGDLAYSELAMFPRLGERTPREKLAEKVCSLRYRRQHWSNRITTAPTSSDQYTAQRWWTAFERPLKSAIQKGLLRTGQSAKR